MVRCWIPTCGRSSLALADDAGSDTEWIETIATVVAKKAPAEWTDHDLLRTRAELPQQVVAFQRLVALHIEQRSLRRRGFDSRRVTVTWPDGDELAVIVTIEDGERRVVEEALNQIVENLGQHALSPGRAQHALLAVLGDRVMPSRIASQDEKVADVRVRGESHG